MQIHELPQHSGTPENESDFAIDTGTNTYKLSFSALGEAVISAFTTTINGVVQTVKAAIEALTARVTTAESNISKYSWFTISLTVVTDNDITTRAKALAYLDDVIIGTGNRFRGIYFVSAFATLIGLPSDSYYAVIMSNSVNGRSLLAWNLNASRMYVITKRNGTWDTDLVRVPTLSTPLFKRVSYTIDDVTLAAGATRMFTAQEVGVSAPSGYVAIGADQIQTNSQCSIGTYSLRATGTNPFLSIKNNSSSSTTINTIYIRVTYARSDMFE